MALAFSGAIGALATERLGASAGVRWFNAWLCLSLLSLGLWVVAGDLRLYILIQFGGLLAMILWLLLPASPLFVRLPWVWLLAGYFAAKLFEFADAFLWTLSGHLFAGHALKHLAAASGMVPLMAALQWLHKQQRNVP